MFLAKVNKRRAPILNPTTRRAIADGKIRLPSNPASGQLADIRRRLAEVELQSGAYVSGPDIVNAPDIVRGVGIGIGDGDLYHGGTIGSETVNKADDAAADDDTVLTFSANALARLRSCRMWSLTVSAFPTSATGGYGATLAGAGVCDVTLLVNGIPRPEVLLTPLLYLSDTVESSAAKSATLGGFELRGTDELSVTVTNRSAWQGANGQTTGFKATIVAGGDRDPYRRQLRFG